MAKSGRNHDEFALHSLRTGTATTLVAGGDTPERVMQREWRRTSDAYKADTRHNIDDSRRVSCKLVVASERKDKQPREGTAGGRK